MADQLDIISEWRSREKKAPSTAAPVKSPARPPSAGIDSSDIIGDFRKSQPAAQSSSGEPGHGFSLTAPLSESILGTSASKEWQQIADKIFPASERKNASWTSRFGMELVKAGPEVIDFIQSPFGMALIAAHMFPATAPIAGIIDIGLGGAGLFQAVPEVSKAFSSGEPEDWAQAVKSVVMSTGMVKGGFHNLAASAARFGAEPLSARSGMRQEISGKETLKERIQTIEKGRAEDMAKRKGTYRVYENAFTREPAKLINIPKPRMMEISSDVVGDRAAFLGEKNYEVNKMLYDFKKEVPLADRAINKMGYVIQGDATPEEVGLSAKAVEWLPRLKEWTANHDEMLRAAYGDELPLQDSEHYLTQVWDLRGRDQGNLRAARAVMNDRFLRKRSIDSYRQGIEEYGMKPRYNDVADLFKIRADFASKSIANRRMAGWLRDLGAIVNEKEYRQLADYKPKEGEQRLNMGLWKRAEDAIALYRASYSDTPQGGGIMMKPVYVHPDFADAANAIFGKNYTHPAWQAYEAFRSIGKKFALSFSMFHHWALTEQAMAISATRQSPFKTLGKLFLVNPEFYKGIKSGVWTAIGRDGGKPPVMRMEPSLVKEWIQAGMNLSSEESEPLLFSRLHEMQQSNNAFLRGMGKVAEKIKLEPVMKMWDTALWDFYHQGMMLQSAETIWASELKTLGPNPSPADVMQRRRTVAEHINNAYGAVSYDKMLVSPKARQALNTLMLAPAWTLSNIRVLTSGYENEASMRLVDRYVKGAAMSWFLSVQAMNLATTAWFSRNDKDGPKAKFTWENVGAPAKIGDHYLHDVNENAFNVYAGKNDDGSDKFMIFGKGFQEPIRWMIAPAETFWGKISLPLRLAMVQATGASPGSGFKEIDMAAPAGERAVQRVAAASEGIGVPFVARDYVQKGMHKLFPEAIEAPRTSSSFMTLPTRKGLSFQRAEIAYRDARDSGHQDEAQQVLAAAAQNGIDPRKIVQTYRQDKRKKQRRAQGPAPK